MIGVGNLIRGKPASEDAMRHGKMADAKFWCLGWDEAVPGMRVGEKAILDITR